MIDRDRVVEILQRTHEGADPLEALEAAGYAVVRAGMVPQLDALDEAEQMLTRLSRILGAIHSPDKTGAAATQIRNLRELALIVRGGPFLQLNRVPTRLGHAVHPSQDQQPPRSPGWSRH